MPIMTYPLHPVENTFAIICRHRINLRRTLLRESSSGKIVKELSKADIEELLAMGFKFPETFTATARDGSTTIYGAMWKPTQF